MKLRALALALLSTGTLLVSADRADAARGFSWYESPFQTNTAAGSIVVRARWHANFADPRCPKEPYIDDFPEDHHACFGIVAVIGTWRAGIIFVRGSGDGSVPFDNFSRLVEGPCVEEKEAGGYGTDMWAAAWEQNIHHRPDHHDVDPHAAPTIVQRDRRVSGLVSLPRCDSGRVVG